MTCLPAWARADASEARADHAANVYYAAASSRARADRTTRTGTPPSARWSSRARCTATCACTGARRSSSGRPSPEEAFEHGPLPQQQVRAGRPRPQRLRRRGLVLRQARPALGRAAGLRQGALHERRRTRRKFDMDGYLRRVAAARSRVTGFAALCAPRF